MMMTRKALVWVVGLLAAAPLSAQVGPQGSSVVEVGLALRQLDGVKRVLMIGAHPDDEDSSLLATLARGMGVETAYLSLTRGDGGQNIIGPELGEGLGIIRTGELEAARVLDGGRQFFTRAFDYGFSKSADEAFAHWPREEVLRDVVSVIRTYRPQVIISVWAGTPRDGHGSTRQAGFWPMRRSMPPPIPGVSPIYKGSQRSRGLRTSFITRSEAVAQDPSRRR